MKLIVASASPRRKDLLTCSGVNIFAVRPSNILEERKLGEEPVAYCKRLAHEKAQASFFEEGYWVLSADTIVVLGDAVFEKPCDGEHAYTMLRSLSGKWHSVVSAWSLRYMSSRGERWIEDHSVSKVKFRELLDVEIYAYIDSGEAFDKAGGYGIQSKGACLVEQIEGCYSTIVGLPLTQVLPVIRANGG